MNSSSKLTLNLLIFLIIIQLISTINLENLLKTEKKIIRSIETYLSSEENRLSQLREMKNIYSRSQSIAEKQGDSYLLNPLIAFKLTKRLTTDFNLAKFSLFDQRSYNQLIDIEKNFVFPSNEDFKDIKEIMIRLQSIYKLNTTLLIDGIIPDHNRRHKTYGNFGESRYSLTSSDCYELGITAYLNQDHYNSIVWMEEAMNRLDKKSLNISNERADILGYIAFSKYKIGSLKEAIDLTQEILLLSPNDANAANNIIGYYKELSELPLDVKTDDDKEVSLIDDIIDLNKEQWSSDEKQKRVLEALCRGEKGLSDKMQSKLVCFYLNTTKIPYLRLMRIKVEEAYKRPQIVIFHDVMSDFEIEIVKVVAKPYLTYATVQNFNTGEVIFDTSHRISQFAFLDDEQHKVIARISRRIGYITGLDLLTAESLQVGYYGIGGHFHCHFDYAMGYQTNVFNSITTGNRIATFLNYMNDVEAGGATVFPYLGITVWPQKGSALFWYNLYASGAGDRLVLHSACPVLMGTKWISTKWFHEGGQEFYKRCSRNIEDYNLVQEI